MRPFDLAKTARVLARLGPRLPQLAEDALIRQTNAPLPVKNRYGPVKWVGLGAGATLLVEWVIRLL
ncbi:MAG: hypothetical protein JKX69_15065 [Rhodobacteraceae bacterium]|nr:hypothetical protein [Paracoccaceae bacterium]